MGWLRQTEQRIRGTDKARTPHSVLYAPKQLAVTDMCLLSFATCALLHKLNGHFSYVNTCNTLGLQPINSEHRISYQVAKPEHT